SSRVVALGCLLLLCVFTCTGQARAQAQVSERFKHVAKEIAKRVASEELENVCKKNNGERDEICREIIGSLKSVFDVVVDGKLDDEGTAAALREEFTIVAQAAAIETARAGVEQLFATIPDLSGHCSTGGVARPLAQCLVAVTYRADSEEK